MYAYVCIYTANGTWSKSEGVDISREDFANTSTLFAFQIEPIFSENALFLSLMKTGQCKTLCLV